MICKNGGVRAYDYVLSVVLFMNDTLFHKLIAVHSPLLLSLNLMHVRI